MISDDASSPEALAPRSSEVIADDDRFAVRRSPERLGLLRQLRAGPADGAAGGAELSPSATRTTAGTPTSSRRCSPRSRAGTARLQRHADRRRGRRPSSPTTYWTHRRNNLTDIASLLLANTVTGAASLFRRELLDEALPFPPRSATPTTTTGSRWCALALGEIAYVDRPLYDYVQHGAAALGHERANQTITRRIRQSLVSRGRDRFERVGALLDHRVE